MLRMLLGMVGKVSWQWANQLPARSDVSESILSSQRRVRFAKPL